MGGRGYRGRRGWTRPDLPSADDAAGWFSGRLPDSWFTEAPEITVDRDEIVVVGTLAAGLGGRPDGSEDDADRSAAEAGRIARFREDTREARMAIAREAEHRYARKVAWGAQSGDTRELFTHLSVPVMTRLRQPERHILDTLVNAGVVRSRSEALAWCVRLVGEHAESWLADLRDAMSAVDQLRSAGPEL